jgi:probable rRNA maturation factor
MKLAPSDGSPPMPAIDVLTESRAWDALPDGADIVRRAIAAAAGHLAWERHGTDVVVLLCDDATIASLNAQWRGIARPTNVLSFPAPPWMQDAPDAEASLGDIAIAYETVAREAEEQGKTVHGHFSHLVVHGFLHLLGYDHQNEDEAERMERLERDILARIGISDPYASSEGSF